MSLNATTDDALRFVVFGRPQGKGSKRLLPIRGKPRAGSSGVVLVDSNKNARPWANRVSYAAVETFGSERSLLRGAVHVSMCFYFARPKAHYGRRGTLLPSSPRQMITAPDVDKLCRNSIDALTGVVFSDDSQIAELVARKQYGEPERLEVTVREL